MSEQKAWTGWEEHVGVKKVLSRVVCFPSHCGFLLFPWDFSIFFCPLLCQCLVQAGQLQAVGEREKEEGERSAQAQHLEAARSKPQVLPVARAGTRMQQGHEAIRNYK